MSAVCLSEAMHLWAPYVVELAVCWRMLIPNPRSVRYTVKLVAWDFCLFRIFQSMKFSGFEQVVDRPQLVIAFSCNSHLMRRLTFNFRSWRSPTCIEADDSVARFMETSARWMVARGKRRASLRRSATRERGGSGEHQVTCSSGRGPAWVQGHAHFHRPDLIS